MLNATACTRVLHTCHRPLCLCAHTSIPSGVCAAANDRSKQTCSAALVVHVNAVAVPPSTPLFSTLLSPNLLIRLSLLLFLFIHLTFPDP